MKSGIKVSEAMTKKLITVSPDSLLPFCARKMLSNNVGCILVEENKKLVGIVTEKDIVEQAVGKELDIKKTKAKEIMTTGVITIHPNADILEAIAIMKREDVRRLPIIENNRVIGILTQKDILKINPSLFKEILKMILKK